MASVLDNLELLGIVGINSYSVSRHKLDINCIYMSIASALISFMLDETMFGPHNACSYMWSIVVSVCGFFQDSFIF